MLRTLYAKLSLTFVVLLLAVGLIVLLVTRYATDNYYQEITQQLNGPIAMYVAQEHPLIENGIVDEDALADLAHQAMVINPTVEVYLLDPQGNILSHALPPGALQLNRVDMQPIRDLLSGNAEMPLRGDDPRNGSQKKIFSVSPVGDIDNLQGYVYVVLGGEKYQTVAQSLEQSYVLKITLALIAAAILFALLTGLVSFHALTRRLRNLEDRVTNFRHSKSHQDPAPEIKNVGADEISSLEQSFDAMAEQIVSQIDHLQHTDEARRDLISSVSHDLRTPLASMQGYIETLLIRHERLSKEDMHKYLEVARKHAVHLGRLVGELFELSKLENLSIVPNPEPFSITELLQDIVQEFQLVARGKRIKLSLETPVDNIIVNGDIGLIQRVLQNLIENALRYTESGGDISISVASKTKHVDVTVADSGCGIVDDNVSRIFDRFYRVESTGPSEVGSAGLGLAIVKRILELHESTINVTSEVNVGTQFTFDLRKEGRAAA